MLGWIKDVLRLQSIKDGCKAHEQTADRLLRQRNEACDRGDLLALKLFASETRKVEAEQKMSEAYRDMRESDTRCQNYIRRCDELATEIETLHATIEADRKASALLIEASDEHLNKLLAENQHLRDRVNLQLIEILKLKGELEKRPAKKPSPATPKVVASKRAPRKKRGAK